jgi:hypothetical protein
MAVDDEGYLAEAEESGVALAEVSNALAMRIAVHRRSGNQIP